MVLQQPTPANRVLSGVPGLDEVLCGGFIEGHSYLMVGEAGTGKTILGLQWLRDGVARGERVLYVTLAEPETEIRANAAAFGWDLQGIEFADLSRSGISHEAGDYQVFAPSEVERAPLWQGIAERISQSQPRRVVLDSLTQLRYLSADAFQFRKQVLALVTFLNERHCTALLAFEPDELAREASAALAVNGVFRLRSEISPAFATGLRSIQVQKMRGSDFLSGLHPLRLDGRGHAIFPHRVERIDTAAPGRERFCTGIFELDSLLGGGLESGTTTLVSGPAGTGKSTLGTHFLARQAPRHRSIVFTFEESITLLVNRARDTGAPIDAAMADGSVVVERINPLQFYPDEFLARVRHEVEREGRSLVMIDSLRGYAFAMEEFGDARAHIHNLVAYLTRRGVTTLLVSEIEHITGPNLVATGMGISHLADNILLMRYADDVGRVMKVISCLKKRGGDFEAELRELRITGSGLRVGAKLQRMRGVLSGAPASTAAAVGGSFR